MSDEAMKYCNMMMAKVQETAELASTKTISFTKGCDEVGVNRDTTKKDIKKLELSLISGEFDVEKYFQNLKIVIEDFEASVRENEAMLKKWLKSYQNQQFAENRAELLKLAEERELQRKEKQKERAIEQEVVQQEIENELNQRIAELNQQVQVLSQHNDDLKEMVEKTGQQDLKNKMDEMDFTLQSVAKTTTELSLHAETTAPTSKVATAVNSPQRQQQQPPQQVQFIPNIINNDIEMKINDEVDSNGNLRDFVLDDDISMADISMAESFPSMEVEDTGNVGIGTTAMNAVKGIFGMNSNSSEASEDPAKKKRGRPKGSKNKPKA